MFRSRDISEQEVYHLLQAGQPYLSNLETETYQNGALRLTWNIPSKQEQDDGLEAARKLGAQAAQGQITIAGKLQAIHDALIRGCVYTENGELRTQMAAGSWFPRGKHPALPAASSAKTAEGQRPCTPPHSI